MIVQGHQAIAAVVAVLVIALAVVVVAGAATGRPMRVAVDRLILAALIGVAVAIALGAGLLLTGRSPRDGLHLVYAGLALTALPVARFALPSLVSRRRAWLLLAGCLVEAGLLVRLLQTG